MATYILAGGNDLRSDDYGTRLAREVYGIIKTRPVRVLSCFFATPLEFQPTAAQTWRQWFERYFGKDTVWSYAVPRHFEEQVRVSDVVYLHGGDNTLLLEALGRYRRLSGVMDRRLVIGSSAGANYLARYFWERRKQQVSRGAGIIPIGVLVHYGVNEQGLPTTDWEAAEHEITEMEDEAILKIREGHFWVVEV